MTEPFGMQHFSLDAAEGSSPLVFKSHAE
jgi:hypothetical protein